MLNIEEEAEEHLGNLLTEGNEDAAIRVAVMGGQQGPVLGLIIDDAGEDDLSFMHKTIPLIIDRKLMEYCNSITIGFRQGTKGSCGGSSGSGFLIESENSLNL